MKALQFLLLAAFLGVLLYASAWLPPRGEVDAPLQRDVSATGTPGAGNYYIEHAYHDAHTDNIVTVVLGDYRSFDTLGETMVVLTAGIACILILGRRES